MKKIHYLIMLFVFLSSSSLFSQETQDWCIHIDDIDPNGYDLTLNGVKPKPVNQGECWFWMDSFLFIVADEFCCGEHTILYTYDGGHTFTINLTLKCGDPVEKPNCTNIHLTPPDGFDDDPTIPKEVYFACDSTPVTYFVDDAPGQTISWNAGSVPVIPSTGSNTVQIIWPAPGSYTITVDVGGDATTYCIEVLESPSDDFMFGAPCGCKNTEISFMSTGIGGNEFFWDFGDGNFGQGAKTTHEYTTAGIYNVTLVVVQDNFDDEMNPLCCCSDTISYPIEILNQEGPPIYWISTLCEGDTTKYWTTAEGCTYAWTAVDANGVNVLPSGTVTTNDTLCVPWGDGPFGLVGLTVTGCMDTTYCPKPTIATIPIIENQSTISGKDTVCYSSNEFYSVPKWPTTEYTWELIPPAAGTIIGNGNSAVVNWNDTTMTATIVVNYHSDFLGGIAGHQPSDCAGFAELEVTIRPEFGLIEPQNTFCLGDSVCLLAGPLDGATITPISFIWEIDPPIGPNTTSTFPGTDPFKALYTNAGIYYVKVYPSAPNPYCNDTVTHRFEIIEVPVMTGIDGPKEVCEGDTATYFGITSITGTEFHWEAVGGTIIGPDTTGNPIMIAWNTSGPYTIIAYQRQINGPECGSDTISCSITRKTLGTGYTISGPSACTNEIMTYSITPIPTDPDITYSWEIQDSLNGSVVAGDTGPTVDIQWNNTQGIDTITCLMTLCDDTFVATRIINVNEADPVSITQNIPFCIGATGVTLMASTPGASYNWQPPATSPALPNAQVVTISVPGNYVLTVTESSGCTAVANYEVFENGLPIVNLTSPDLLTLCIQDVGSTIDLHALVGGYYYDWFKSVNGGSYIQLLDTTPVIIHTNNGVVGYCDYYYIATDTISGCEEQSNILTVSQIDCDNIPPPPCDPGPYSTIVNNNPILPYCDSIQFTTVNSTNVSVTAWDFGDPPFNTLYTGPITAPIHNYDEAGYYIATMFGTVPNIDNTATCTISDTTLVCVPLAADFDYTYDCGVYTFTSTSSWITGSAPVLYEWDFDDGNSAMGISTTHTYTTFSPPDFDVKLTITDSNGCKSIKIIPIEVLPPPTASIVVMPPDTCVNKPFMFSNASNTGIVAWDWAFGDSSTNGGSDPKHSYGAAGTYMVTLTVTDENGCTNSDVESVIVHPAATTGPITYIGDLFLCANENLVLNAPAGNQYIWSTGATTPSITVNMTDTYGVTVTDINGCTFIPDSVDVVVFPPIDASISGSNVICDEGCTTLYAVNTAGYTYSWFGDFGGLPANPGGNSVEICYDQNLPISNVILIITDENNCTQSSSIPIDYGMNPVVSIIAAPQDPCEGTLTTLTAVSTINPVDYLWSSGETTFNIDVILEGTYTVTVTDPATGCSGTESINVNPLPDLCIVPYGCYTACDPDTICGPSGLDEYEWFFNGVIQPMYSGMECIIVTQSGVYNFAGTNEFNCKAFSDSLYLELIPCCRPGDTDISAAIPAGQEGCCYAFNYSVNQDIFYSLDLRSDDADLGLDLGSVNPLLGATPSLPSLISFENATSGSPLPQGPIFGFATICLENTTSNPVEIIADWIGEDGELLCSDTLLLECLVEPDCIYVESDTIYCGPDGNLIYDVTICNPLDAAYSISYIDFLELTPPGVMFNPSEIDLSGTPLLPGDCIDLSLAIVGSGLANQTLCYNLVGHQYDPNENPGALCCSVDTTYCVFMPGCTPCDMVYVSGIDSSSIGDCCYDVTVNNYYDDMAFAGIDLCVLTPGATFDVFNPISSPWDVTSLTTTTASLDYDNGSISSIPLGDTPLPTICVGDNETAYVDVEIKWMSGGVIFCRDTISLLCPGDCGYMPEATLICGPNGTWIFTGYITNTSTDTMDSAHIDFGQDVLNAYDTDINLNGLAPGDTFGPFSIVLNNTPGVGPDLCIITTLHANDHNDNHEDCCQFKTVVPVPDCEDPVDCLCGPEFEEQVALGMTCDPDGTPFTYIFSPAGNFGECDQVVWDFKDQQISYLTYGNASITHTFPGPGEYTVCIKITRTQADGKKCKEKFCKDVVVSEEGFVAAYPNPVTNLINLVPEETSFEGMATIEIMDSNNRKWKSMKVALRDREMTSIDVSDVKSGIYMIRIQMDDKIHTKRILIVR